MVSPEKLHSLNEIPYFEPSHIGNALLDLYNEPLSAPTPILSFGYLWRFLELIESSANTAPAVDEELVEEASIFFVSKGLDPEFVKTRILGSLKSIKVEKRDEKKTSYCAEGN